MRVRSMKYYIGSDYAMHLIIIIVGTDNVVLCWIHTYLLAQ